MDNIRNELLAEMQQLRNNQDELKKDLDKVMNKSKEVNTVKNLIPIKISGLLIE